MDKVREELPFFSIGMMVFYSIVALVATKIFLIQLIVEKSTNFSWTNSYLIVAVTYALGALCIWVSIRLFSVDTGLRWIVFGFLLMAAPVVVFFKFSNTLSDVAEAVLFVGVTVGFCCMIGGCFAPETAIYNPLRR